MGERYIGVLLGKPEGKRPRARHKLRWQDNFNMDLQEVVWEDMVWLDMAQDWRSWSAIVNGAMNFWVS